MQNVDDFSIENCLSFSFRPMMPSLNVHFQSTDIPTADGHDMEEPLPPSEARVELLTIDKPNQ